MSWIDGLICAVMLLGFIHGLLKGAIQEIFLLIGLVIGIIGASRATNALHSFTDSLQHPLAARFFVFVLVFILIVVVVALIGKLFSKLFKAAGLSFVDRLIGGVLGALVCAIILGVFFSVLERFDIAPGVGYRSIIAPYLMRLARLLTSLVPGLSSRVESNPINVGWI
ncbi:MAG: CvpA family protein [bacterium]